MYNMKSLRSLNKSVNKNFKNVLGGLKKINLQTAICYAIIAIYVGLHLRFKKYRQVVVFGLVFLGLMVYTGKMEESLVVAIIASYLVTFFVKDSVERFEDGSSPDIEAPQQQQGKKPVAHAPEPETVPSGDDGNNGDDEDDDYGKDNSIDLGTSFMEAYKSLSPGQVSAMTKDTKELIKTQKHLMSTLQNLGPLIKEGKGIMDSFKGYFDPKDLKNLKPEV